MLRTQAVPEGAMVRKPWAGLIVVVVGMVCGRGLAQYEGPAESLRISASRAYTWVDGDTNIVLLNGPVSIELDKTRMAAQDAVVWISPLPRAVLDQDRVEIALLGDASLAQPNGVTRSGPRLFVESRVRGVISFSAPRTGRNMSDSELFAKAMDLRPQLLRPREPGGQWIVQEDAGPTTAPATRPSFIRPVQPVMIRTDSFNTVTTPDGYVAAILSGNVLLLRKTGDGAYTELRADRVVVFTPLRNLADLPRGQQLSRIQEAVTGVYLEGDVAINNQPADATQGEQRLTANRAFYDFTTDRAVLTDVVMHTMDTKTEIPVIVRANAVRQLSQGEFQADKAILSSSSFNTPSYAIGASSVYIRQVPVESSITGTRTRFSAVDPTFRVGGLPVFWLPAVGGTVPEKGLLRGAEISNSGRMGFGVSTEWGLYETLGKAPPSDLDLTYLLDFYSERGPAFGLNGVYEGGYIDRRTLDPWSYEGRFLSYLAFDGGEDDFGRRRIDIDPEDQTRYRIWWQHQHFLPDDWQIQLTAGYLSDPTFMEQWFNRDWRNSRPLDTSLYAKRQRDTEAFTFLLSFQPNSFATVSETYQEQFEIERLPELSYRRVGDSFWGDRLTFFSANTLSALRFHKSDYELEDLGFPWSESPGLAAQGLPWSINRRSPTDQIDDDLMYRGDFRQEVTWPFGISRFRAVPYVVGRYTYYSDTVKVQTLRDSNGKLRDVVDSAGSDGRVAMSGGMRLTTAYWKVDDSVESRFFDLHRLRHVIEPEINVFASTQSLDRDELWVYDEPIDAASDAGAVEIALRQRWQTKRGGPGNWRSVDFFTLNTNALIFFNEPDVSEQFDKIEQFRGLYFVSLPEASIPRTSINIDAEWRIADAVAALGDTQFNLEESSLATASIGLRVQQADRLGYYVGLRHIDLSIDAEDDFRVNGNRFVFEDQDLFLFALNYQLTTKYQLTSAYSYDLAQNRMHRAEVSLVRHFDRFFASVSLRVDKLDDESAVVFNIWPEGMRPGTGSQAVSQAFDGNSSSR